MFIEIAEQHPRFLRKQLVEVVGAMLQVSMLGAGVCWFSRVAVCDVYVCVRAAACASSLVDVVGGTL
jgi:hypothetical protein